MDFKESVINNFYFLEFKYGFTRSLIESNEYAQVIIYEKADFYVLLTYGSTQYEPSMSFGIQGPGKEEDDHGFDVSDLLRLECCQDWIWNENKASDNKFDNWLSELARILILCGEPLLHGDYDFLKEIKIKRNQRLLNWQEEERIKKIRSDIENSWRLKDFERVICLYESVTELTDRDKIIISIAKRKL